MLVGLYLIPVVENFFQLFVVDKGMRVEDRDPMIFWENCHGDVLAVSDWFSMHYQT